MNAPARFPATHAAVAAMVAEASLYPLAALRTPAPDGTTLASHTDAVNRNALAIALHIAMDAAHAARNTAVENLLNELARGEGLAMSLAVTHRTEDRNQLDDTAMDFMACAESLVEEWNAA
ncbi:hypothetical protein C4N9_20770 [Pararhodobacter marinus]|uniref:Uncharacterized protein n=1 Tax=Pararhodobacter marinus TaxID=2184063 RepID=A0A2U2C481_9RHOB|nr:hypothetical protein [Pararhodobacter marinus]PWE26696.1 hypothetical protein C4N9_20770 [Pararhodobacter marinus]